MIVCFVMKVGWFVLAVRAVVWRVYLDMHSVWAKLF